MKSRRPTAHRRPGPEQETEEEAAERQAEYEQRKAELVDGSDPKALLQRCSTNPGPLLHSAFAS